MADSTNELLKRLQNNDYCNDELAQRIKKTVLEPFKVDPSRSESLKQPPRAVFKHLVNTLAPLSMQIVNQNIVRLENLKKRQQQINNRTVVINCLVDSSFYAIAALRHMNATKPLDIEKTTSNLLCKMVDLGEFAHALDELVKFQDILASLTKVQLKRDITKKDGHRVVRSNRGYLTESQNIQREQQPQQQSMTPNHVYESSVSRPAPLNQWEDDMLKKYEILFQFPNNNNDITDTTMVLLVLAYQMNSIRCWCGINDKSLSKYLPYLLEQPGSFIDWAKHLCILDPELGKRQLDALQRMLIKTSNGLPNSNDTPYHVFTLQALSSIIALHNANSVKAPMDRLIRSGMTYEKNSKLVNYSHIQKYCGEALKDVTPSTHNLLELEAYFTLCEYYAYISKKAKSYKGAFYAYKAMIRPVREIITVADNHQYYHSAYAANAKLLLGSVQMDKIATDDTYFDINTTLREVTSCLHIALNDLKKSVKQDEFFDQALFTLCKSIEIFKQSASRFYDFIMKKAEQSLKEQVTKKDPFKTPPRHKDIPSSENMGAWTNITPQLSRALQQCSEVLPAHILIIKKKPSVNAKQQKRSVTHDTVMLSFVDIMSLLARIQFNVDDENTHEQAYDYLSTAEEVCADSGFSSGYRWLSSSYYNLGASMFTAKYYSSAVYPLRKSCTLLEKDTSRISTDEGKLQLCKRYEVLGSCCQKKDTFDDSLKAYRLSLKRVPVQSLETFVAGASTTCVSTLIEKFPLVPKIMDRFLRASVVDDQQQNMVYAYSMMNLSSLTPIQVAIIQECELKIWNSLSRKMNLSKYQFDIMDKLLNVYDEKLYPIRRARVLLEKVRLERAQIKDPVKATRSALAAAIEAANLLSVESYGNDGDLLGYRRHYLALASSWVALCKRELNEEIENAFSTSLQQWGILLRKIPTIYDSDTVSKADVHHVYDKMDDIDKLYDHVRMLSDLFGMTGKYIYQINALRILLKLNNGLRAIDVDHISDSIFIGCTLAKTYCDLGYTGKASLELAKIRKVITSKPCTNMAEVAYLVCYSYYLAQVGDLELSKETFNAAKIAWETSEEVDNASKSALSTARQAIVRCKLLSDAYMTRSVILSLTDTLDSTIRSCNAGLHLLFRAASIIKKKNEERQNNSLEDPFGNPTESNKKDADAHYANVFAANIAFKESQWVLAQKISEGLQKMATLHMLKGSWQEAKYYIKQGPALGEKVNSESIRYYSQINLSDHYLHCGRFEESQRELKIAFDIQKKEKFVTQDSVKLKIAMINYELKQGHLDVAIDTVDEANEMLEELKTNESIIAIEKWADIDATTPTTTTDESYEQQVQSSLQSECKLINQLQADLAIKKAIAYALQGEIPKSNEILEELEESGLMFKNEVELGTTLAYVKIGSIDKEIKENPAVSVILNKVMSLPLMKFQSTRVSVMRKDNNKSQDFRMIKDSLSETIDIMVEMYRAGAIREPIDTLHRLCKKTGYSMFLKNQLVTGGVLVGSHAALSSYYIEMGDGVGLRREMISCLEGKNRKYIDEAVPNDIRWPKPFAMDEEMTERFSDNPPFQYNNTNTPKWLQAHIDSLLDQYQEEHTLDDNEFQEKFIDILPKNWTVCSLSLDPETEEIYAVQLKQKQAPIVLKIPLHRIEQHKSITKTKFNTFKYEDAVAEMKNIIEESDVTIAASRDCTEESLVEQWWKTRKELDDRLRRLLISIENQWLGGFKGMLSGQVPELKEEINRFQKSASELIFKAISGQTGTKKRIEISLNCCRMILRLGYNPQATHIEDVVYFLLSCYELQEVKIDYEIIKISDLVQNLKTMISQYHEKSRVAGLESTKTQADEHIILILDKHLHMFPLESMPILRNQSVSRLPCLSFLRDRIQYARAYNNRGAFNDFGLVNAGEWTDQTASKKNTFYVVNPSGDLKHTQQEFENIFKRAPGWDGLVNEMPTELQSKSALLSKDIYIYMGHGAGQSFMRGQVVKQLPRCAVSLLMGCSSGALQSNGDYDPHGYVLNYLLGGSPAVVANLWDVTDRSIDKLAKQLLTNWGMFGNDLKPRMSLVQAVAESRNHCNLPFLIGAAPVVYGIPVYLN